MNNLPELGSKRNRNCVSPVQEVEESRDTSMCESSNSKEPSASTNVVWQQWTTTFRASRRLKNDLLKEEGIDATVERHMTLSKKKRSLFDDDSDSDDESNYYKLDVPPPQQQQQQQLRHPSEFTPSGFLPRLGPQQVTPASFDPEALPTCTLRRFGHDDDGLGCYDAEDRIPPPPSFHRYPSKKRAVGLARPEPEQDYYNNRGTSSTSTDARSSSSHSISAPPPIYTTGGAAGPMAAQKDETTRVAESQLSQSIFPVPPPFAAALRRPNMGTGEEKSDGALPPPPATSVQKSKFNYGMGSLAEEKDPMPEDEQATPLPPSLSAHRTARPFMTATAGSLAKLKEPTTTNDASSQAWPLPPPAFAVASRTLLNPIIAGLGTKAATAQTTTATMMAPPPLQCFRGKYVHSQAASSVSQGDEDSTVVTRSEDGYL